LRISPSARTVKLQLSKELTDRRTTANIHVRNRKHHTEEKLTPESSANNHHFEVTARTSLTLHSLAS